MNTSSFFVLLALLTVCSAEPVSNCGLFCNLCQQGLSLIQRNLVAIESVTHDELIGVINHVCNLAPNVDIVRLVCDVAKDDVIDGINKLLAFLKKSTDPSTTCHQLYLC
ncbi:unnamed protein product [Caenorhabditis sp. 36 PRJEB53466]|nr:unnamed protein product [Caenorhabditis sp. 36 PRJEB53466]